MLSLLGQASEFVTIAVPVGLIVVFGQAVVNATTSWLSRRNGSGKVQKEIRDALQQINDSPMRILLEQTNGTLSRMADRLDRHMSIMEGGRCDAGPDSKR